MVKAYPRYKTVEIEGQSYRIDFDGEFTEVSIVVNAPSSFGWTYPLKVRVKGIESDRAIWAAGKSFSGSKHWKREHKQAGNRIWEADRMKANHREVKARLSIQQLAKRRQ